MNLRSAFAKDIFAQDLLCVYKKQTEHRDELRAQSREMITEIVSKINTGTYDNPKLEGLLSKLAGRLSKTKGKKQYGYLKADVKAIVNQIVSELAADDRIAALYDLWYEQKEEIIRTYTQELPQRVSLVDNPEFKSIRNAVIQEALNLIAELDNPDAQYTEEELFVEGEENTQNAYLNSNRNWSAGMGAVRLLHHISRVIWNRIEDEQKGKGATVDRKLRRRMEEKKQAHGMKQG